jgi:hypothetical protein
LSGRHLADTRANAEEPASEQIVAIVARLDQVHRLEHR